jgi:type 1 glutamine amidotransferase/glyoxylase-like metal-dependent hydrolase (beta-lactamase superfamily II)
MPTIPRTICLFIIITGFCARARCEDAKPRADRATDQDTSRVYGEWRIHVRPDQGPAYDRLIAQSGLPLFREAGGRMVGWWKTLVGDLYEHVTIWEYDNMAAFEGAIKHLSTSAAFAEFVAKRDPLLAGEENRFLRLVPKATRPQLADPAVFVIHEIHRVPLARREAYLSFMMGQGLSLLENHGFRPVGPWVVDVGQWSEVTYLFRFASLAEREKAIAAFSATPDAKTYGGKVAEFVSDVSTRLLVPAPFASPPPGASKPKPASAALPHREEIAPGVHAAGFSDRHHSANCGWVTVGDETLLIDLPRGQPVTDFLALVAASTGKPARTLVLTNAMDGDLPTLHALIKRGITQVLTSPSLRARLTTKAGGLDPATVRPLPNRASIGSGSMPVDFVPLDEVASNGSAAVYLPSQGVLFAGPLVVNGPRASLIDSNTAEWVSALRRLEKFAPTRVVPGFGSWGGPELLDRQRRFLTELREQVGYHVAQGRPYAGLRDVVRLSPDYLVWMPYDTPLDVDLDHVYKELTVPAAPYGGRPPDASDPRPHALVLIGDQPHEPAHLEEGLRPVFEATGVVPHFTVDVRALSAENLAKVKLLVILRDGLQRPDRESASQYMWMTPAQQDAVASFVEGGGGFLNLHNSMGLYPAAGPYLRLVGGRYVGHGPLERFRVEVVDGDHPVTRGVSSFFVADEQHTPPVDEGRVRLLLRNTSDEGKTAAAGWVREPGRGRLCHLANGHTREALLHPMFQKLLRNAVQWCVRATPTSAAD